MFFVLPLFFLGKTAVSLRFGRIWRDFPWFSYEKNIVLSLIFPRKTQFFVIFLGFPTKKHSLVLDFPSGKHCFSCILDGFGVIPFGFPREDLHELA